MLVEHDVISHRFTVRLPAGNGDLYYRMLLSGVMDIYRTEVDEGLRGQGVAGELTAAAVEYARNHGLRVKASCDYVSGWLKKHPEEAMLAAT